MPQVVLVATEAILKRRPADHPRLPDGRARRCRPPLVPVPVPEPAAALLRKTAARPGRGRGGRRSGQERRGVVPGGETRVAGRITAHGNV